MPEFFDALSALCAREISAATKAADYDRSAAVIEGLATMLGRSIAIASHGDSAKISNVLAGVENHIAAEAAGFAGVIHLGVLARTRRADP